MERVSTTLDEFEHRARELLVGPDFPQPISALFSRPGDRPSRTNSANLQAFDRLSLRPRVLSGIAERSLSCKVLGEEITLPVLVAPSAGHQRVRAEGELATARAAGRSGTVMVVSMGANFDVEEVAEIASGPLWFQVYVLKDRGLTAELIKRAYSCGYRALVITVDNVAGINDAERRRNLWKAAGTPGTLEPQRHLRNFVHHPELLDGPDTAHFRETALSWRDIEWLQGLTPLPVVIKGVQRPEDAQACVDLGLAGLVVSNHGGTPIQMEGVRATIQALPDVVNAVGDQLEIYLDGGIRSGRDVFKALALGARAVMTGRPVQWGLAVNGEEGVHDILEILRRELDSVMGICGVGSLSDIDGSFVCRSSD